MSERPMRERPMSERLGSERHPRPPLPPVVTEHHITITARQDAAGTWSFEAMDRLSGTIATRARISPDSRIGRGLVAIAAMLE